MMLRLGESRLHLFVAQRLEEEVLYQAVDDQQHLALARLLRQRLYLLVHRRVVLQVVSVPLLLLQLPLLHLFRRCLLARAPVSSDAATSSRRARLLLVLPALLADHRPTNSHGLFELVFLYWNFEQNEFSATQEFICGFN